MNPEKYRRKIIQKEDLTAQISHLKLYNKKIVYKQDYSNITLNLYTGPIIVLGRPTFVKHLRKLRNQIYI